MGLTSHKPIASRSLTTAIETIFSLLRVKRTAPSKFDARWRLYIYSMPVEYEAHTGMRLFRWVRDLAPVHYHCELFPDSENVGCAVLMLYVRFE